MKVSGGFFWLHDEPGITFVDGEDAVVAQCTFVERPKWWQIRRWYQAWRLWLALPHL